VHNSTLTLDGSLSHHMITHMEDSELCLKFDFSDISKLDPHV